MTDEPKPTSSEPTSSTSQAEVTVRRAPRYPRFIIIGGGLGAVVTFALTLSFPIDPKVGLPATVGYFLLYGIPIGVVLGSLVAIALDRVSVRRARSATAELTTVDPLPEPEVQTDEDTRPDRL